ncbi:LuxR C-terminal-related transcriptional regulator [Gandjariella thermophila]|uniref:HTH luxR-type domain-containing protein n=1 Tax=Gandjariella thermophila TaxID=1931992 RepID=A0A4D4IZQ0_9PSEU|nr:LuxR family transcriptional regulator [Gandjariella thermophila]GDY29815.1 hypothetical protein GTS_14480 [Gandjariella thermophila]
MRNDRRHAEPPLVEREREQTVLASVVAELAGGRSAMVTVTGRPGRGQDALLRWTADLGHARGLRVLRARATPAERDLPHGVVVQLLTALLGPAAGPVRALVGGDPGHHLPGLPALLGAARALPTLVAVADTQWLDAASLRWLRALARRLPSAPVALVASRDGAPPPEPGWPAVDAVPAGPVLAMELPLAPLSARGVATAVESICGVPGDEHFVAAAAATAGSPAVLEEALRAFAGRGYPPVAERVPELCAAAAAVTGEHVTRVLRGLPGEAVAVLRALAVCGDLLDFPLVCSLAEPRPPDQRRVRDTLEAAGLAVTDGDTLRICGPVVRSRVLEDMPAAQRADLHGRAAELAYRAALPDDQIAELLVRAEPSGARWALLALRRAAATARRERDPRRAAGYLSRALAEPLAPAHRVRLSLERAGIEAVTTPEASDRRLGELARAATAEPGLRARAVDLGLARGDAGWALRAAAEALPGALGAERDRLIALFWLAEQTRQDDTELMVPAVPGLPDRPGTPAQAGVRAWQLALRGEHPDAARELARRALVGSDPLVLPRLAACWTLCLTEDWAEAGDRLDALLAAVRPEHAPAAAARVLTTRAELNLRRGRLAAVSGDLAAAERALPRSGWHPHAVPHLIAVRVAAALESGRFDEARALADAPAPSGVAESVLWSCVLFTKAWLAALKGRWADAAAWSRECGRRLLRRQWTNPALLPWRSLTARASGALGDHAEAVRLAREEVALARRWGTPGTLDWAEHCLALLDGDRPASRTPRAAPAGLAAAWALTERAAAELAAGHRDAAEPLLTEASAIPARYPSGLLARRVREVAARMTGPAGGDPPGPAWTALSEPERRVATLAARGHANRDIAERLAVSTRTVQHRLSSAYRKLGIGGRAELGELVRAMEGT